VKSWQSEPRGRLILVEDEDSWVAQIAPILEAFTGGEAKVFRTYDEAARFLDGPELAAYSGAIVDVRLREPIYDQGGLALLDIIKARHPSMPVVVMTAYSDDYPGLRKVTSRYSDVLVYDKAVFLENSDTVLGHLLSELPPQIGDSLPEGPAPRSEAQSPSRTMAPQTSTIREIIDGTAIVVFVLAAAGGVLGLFHVFSNYPFQLNVVFSLVVVVLLCVLIRIFRPDVVLRAVGIYRQLTGKSDNAHSLPQGESGSGRLEGKAEDGQTRNVNSRPDAGRTRRKRSQKHEK
jgi:CheY-like chemotaxis protein